MVVISTVHGLKFVDFKAKYHENLLVEMTSKFANLPEILAADVNVVRGKIMGKVRLIKS